MIMISLAFTACSSAEVDSVKDTDVIAEYTASLLLKYDKTYKEKLIESAYLEELEKEEKEESDEKDSTNPDIVQGDRNQSKPVQVSKNQSLDSSYEDFSKLLSNEGIAIQYKKYGLYDNYPVEPEEPYFALQNSEGKKLCILEFDLANHSSKKKSVNLIKSGIDYQLEINSVKYNPLFTLLENDLQLLHTDIKANSSDIAYLVFEIPEDIEIKTGQLYVVRGSLSFKTGLQ